MPAFDTLKATKLLKASGFEETQAEAVVATVRDAIAENVATKADVTEASNELKLEIAGVRAEIAGVRAEIKDDIADLRTETKAEIAKVRTEIANARTEIKDDIANVQIKLKDDIEKVSKEISDFRTEIHHKALYLAAGIIGIIVSLIKLLP